MNAGTLLAIVRILPATATPPWVPTGGRRRQPDHDGRPAQQGPSWRERFTNAIHIHLRRARPLRPWRRSVTGRPPEWGKGSFQFVLVTILLAAVFACEVERVPVTDPAAAPSANELEMQEVHHYFLTGLDRIDDLRRRATDDLNDLLSTDPHDPAVDDLRAELREIDNQEKWIRWYERNGFTVNWSTIGAKPYTLEDFWRQVIEDREHLELTDGAVLAIQELIAALAAKRGETQSVDSTILELSRR